jgi:hypothetical protein
MAMASFKFKEGSPVLRSSARSSASFKFKEGGVGGVAIVNVPCKHCRSRGELSYLQEIECMTHSNDIRTLVSKFVEHMTKQLGDL